MISNFTSFQILYIAFSISNYVIQMEFGELSNFFCDSWIISVINYCDLEYFLGYFQILYAILSIRIYVAPIEFRESTIILIFYFQIVYAILSVSVYVAPIEFWESTIIFMSFLKYYKLLIVICNIIYIIFKCIRWYFKPLIIIIYRNFNVIFNFFNICLH